MRNCGSSRPISDPRLTYIKTYYCNYFLKGGKENGSRVTVSGQLGRDS